MVENESKSFSDMFLSSHEADFCGVDNFVVDFGSDGITFDSIHFPWGWTVFVWDFLGVNCSDYEPIFYFSDVLSKFAFTDLVEK